MERLGVEDGEYIESKMVTRAVEKAQKKVENLHFEGRKQIVEYDDVANEQRKIVYRFRNQLLDPEFDIRAKVDEIRAAYVERTLDECGILEGVAREDFDREKLVKVLKEEINFTTGADTLEGLDYDALHENLLGAVKEAYETKMSIVDENVRKGIEREIYLKTLDTAWREHLYRMDTMKTGIRLRAYNQKDPLVEYKKESFNLFTELIETIKYDTIKTLQIIQFQLRSPEEEAEAFAKRQEIERRQKELQMQLNRASEAAAAPAAKKPARNDPCPCGSGKKYKNCCGQSGPKKGAFAS